MHDTMFIIKFQTFSNTFLQIDNFNSNTFKKIIYASCKICKFLRHVEIHSQQVSYNYTTYYFFFL